MMEAQPQGSQTGPGYPAAAVRAGRGAGFWILILGGCFGVGVILLIVGVFLAGVFAGLSEESGTPGAPSTTGTAGSAGTSAPSGAGEPDDFIYKSPANGMEFIAPNQIVAEGVSVTLAGLWREDHRSITLRLLESGRYELTIGGGALSGRTKYDLVASTSAELGTWTFAGATLTLTPDQRELSGIAEGKSNSGKEKADAPRQWNVVGVTIEYTPNGSNVTKQRPGLRVRGPGPSWYYPPGEVNWVLRSAR
ncbi:MAG: hypothetical protein AAB074_13325 [Planctomycetota bacterium]